MGVYAVEALLQGKSNMMVGMKSEEIIFSPLEKAIKGKSEINKDLIRVSDILTI
jgi:6-phosphofructokinase 1